MIIFVDFQQDQVSCVFFLFWILESIHFATDCAYHKRLIIIFYDFDGLQHDCILNFKSFFKVEWDRSPWIWLSGNVDNF